MEFYFDIKARRHDTTDISGYDKWIWPPVWSGRVESTDRYEARHVIEDEYNRKFIMKEGTQTKEEPFLLSIKPMTDYLRKRFELKKCEICGTEYTLNDAYNTGSNGRFCSIECSEIYNVNRNGNYGTEYNPFYSNLVITPPVIYKVTNKITGMVYVGKSTQSVTLRWWQHIRSGISSKGVIGVSKFYKAMSESELTDWTYEMIEVIIFPDNCQSTSDRNRYILERETYWIQELNSIRNGYNSVESIKLEDRNQLKLFDLDTNSEAGK